MAAAGLKIFINPFLVSICRILFILKLLYAEVLPISSIGSRIPFLQKQFWHNAGSNRADIR
jgi:hypothetical protein